MVAGIGEARVVGGELERERVSGSEGKPAAGETASAVGGRLGVSGRRRACASAVCADDGGGRGGRPGGGVCGGGIQRPGVGYGLAIARGEDDTGVEPDRSVSERGSSGFQRGLSAGEGDQPGGKVRGYRRTAVSVAKVSIRYAGDECAESPGANECESRGLCTDVCVGTAGPAGASPVGGRESEAFCERKRSVQAPLDAGRFRVARQLCL